MKTKKSIEIQDKKEKHDGESGNQNRMPIPKGILIAIGGKENKDETAGIDSNQQDNANFEQTSILQRFVDELEGPDPLIVIIPTASTEPEEAVQDYVKVFRHLKASNIKVADIRSREDACKTEFLEMARKARGIMFTGGSQLRITSLLGGTEFLDLLKDRYTHSRIVIAGTSAGATALSTPMIFQGAANDAGFRKGEIHIATGLEFLKDVAIDTHFIARGRIVRMAQMIALNPGAIGIGLEEDTAVVVTGGSEIEVIGNGIITVVDGHPMTYTNINEVKDGEPLTMCDLTVHFLSKGERYHINKREQTYR
jgi:cyanophycinase